HDCIVGRRQGNRIAWLMTQPDGSTARQAVPVKHELQDFETVLMAAKAGHGLTQLPSWMVEGDLQDGALQIVLEGLSGGELPISVLWPQTKALPAKIRVTIDGLVQWSLVSTSVAA
ncbi:LysR substrate-binding domain-containing protein, partial [Mesorhizobium sp. B1-1-5]|uniref:LysR substrate-binding domain-containing protein n=1 Tax=Mesorhizobium sp. B1-1-5 TaxID=2589979 RepID=UPI0011707BFB